MRNVLLHGYVVHQRRFREKSVLVYLMSLEHGRIDGIMRGHVPPLYQPMLCYASGRSQLKNLSKTELSGQMQFLEQSALFAGFYLNELLLKICPVEVPMPQTFVAYIDAITALNQINTDVSADQSQLKQILRRFEWTLLDELGYSVDFSVDHLQQAIVSSSRYKYILDQGFVEQFDYAQSDLSADAIAGSTILSLHQYSRTAASPPLDHAQINLLSQIFKRLINHLLSNKPLKSRQLWQSYIKQ